MDVASYEVKPALHIRVYFVLSIERHLGVCYANKLMILVLTCTV